MPPAITRTEDGFDTLFSERYNQTYHSIHGAAVEAEHVFFRGAGVEARCKDRLPTRILEIGFGTGLNFLLTAQRTRASRVPIHYTGLEQDVLSAESFASLNHAAKIPGSDLCAWRSTLPYPTPPGTYTYNFSPQCVLELVVGDAAIGSIPGPCYHAVYLDAFSPEVNPELWTPVFLARLFALTCPGGRLATYSAKGIIRRRLAACGYGVERKPGPPGKREMLVGRKPH